MPLDTFVVRDPRCIEDECAGALVVVDDARDGGACRLVKPCDERVAVGVDWGSLERGEGSRPSLGG
jgi:hypothetical protein